MSSTMQTYPPSLSFACDDGRGMELFFVSQYLVVLSRQGKNKHAWIKFNYRFKKERWCVPHSFVRALPAPIHDSALPSHHPGGTHAGTSLQWPTSTTSCGAARSCSTSMVSWWSSSTSSTPRSTYWPLLHSSSSSGLCAHSGPQWY